MPRRKSFGWPMSIQNPDRAQDRWPCLYSVRYVITEPLEDHDCGLDFQIVYVLYVHCTCTYSTQVSHLETRVKNCLYSMLTFKFLVRCTACVSVTLVCMHIEVQVPGTCNKGYNLDLVLVNAWSMVVVHVLMRDEKEERKKQARSNKQQD